MERRTYLFTGRVQGVGFRYTARRAAAGRDVTGFIRNLDDGRVELVMEGTEAEMDAVVEDIIRIRIDSRVRSTGRRTRS